jgi:murein DD-endopeptidase MepM/ murein hydrolase activator NlpD
VKRAAAVVAALGLLPIVAWASASAGPESAVDCVSPTTSPGDACVSPAPGAAVAPATPAAPAPTAAPPPAPTTTAPAAPGEAGATTVPGPPSSDPGSTVVPETPSTESTTTTTTIDPAATTTTLDPNATTTTTVDPNATTTTVDPNSTTTLDPNATTTTLAPSPPPEEDIETQPVTPPVEAPSGRVVVPTGSPDIGQVRPITFPVAGPVSYVNDFGACRDGCTRSHKGNDVIGDRLQPILAMHDGVIDHLIINHPTAGWGVAIRDDEGWQYHVYHMNNDTPGTDDAADDGTWRFLPGIVPGARVTAGQQIGWMGDSGNSEGSVPHAHVEIHTPQGMAINPYWSLRAAQRAVDCAVGTVGQPMPAAPGATTTSTTTPVAAPDAQAPQALAAPDGTADSTTATAPSLAMTTRSASAAAPDWLASGWAAAALPAGWTPFTVTGGHPGSGQVAARFWISTQGYTPVDAAAARVGDPRYDAGVDCSQPAVEQPSAPIPAELGAILATIRAMESGGDYAVSITTSTASGAYAFLDTSWGGFGGYARAKDAPPSVQDTKAAEMAAAILSRNGGDVSAIPVSWYIGHVPIGAEWDTVPVPEAGNRLTPRQYQDRWMGKYAQLIGDPSAWVSGAGLDASMLSVATSGTCRTVVVDVGTDGQAQYALTQAQSFLVASDGRAVPNADDPCDPGRILDAAPPAPPAAPAAPAAPGAPAQDTLATLVDPVVLRTSGPR